MRSAETAGWAAVVARSEERTDKEGVGQLALPTNGQRRRGLPLWSSHDCRSGEHVRCGGSFSSSFKRISDQVSGDGRLKVAMLLLLSAYAGFQSDAQQAIHLCLAQIGPARGLHALRLIP